MPKFSDQSEDRLLSCDERLQKLFNTVIEHWDCTVLDGHRGKERQEEAFRTGMSKLQFPKSPHNVFPSLAVDVAPYPIKWADRERFIYFAGKVMAVAKLMGIPLRFGGDWSMDDHMADETFRDLVHYEIITEGKKK